MLYFKNLQKLLHCISHIVKLLKSRIFSLLSLRDSSRRKATAGVARPEARQGERSEPVCLQTEDTGTEAKERTEH